MLMTDDGAAPVSARSEGGETPGLCEHGRSRHGAVARRVAVLRRGKTRQADMLQALRGIPVESEHCALLAATTLRAACGNAGTERA